MNLPGPVTYWIKEDDHFAFNALMFRRTWTRCLILALPSAAIVAVPIAWFQRSVMQGIILVVVGVVAAGLYAFGIRLFLRPRVSKVYRETAALQEEMTLFVEEGGVRIEQASGMHRTKWGNLVRWDEDNHIFTLFINRWQAFILPKQQVHKDVVDFMREQMKQSGLPRPWKLRK
ncbi:MAG: hypothetical protein C0471_09185 [Erythrobacter sp.]|nr:hypothetical protein [Erythrobacter sp.]